MITKLDVMKKKRNRAKTFHFDILINGEKLPVKATPYHVNEDEPRFRVSYNGSPVIIFAWNNEMNKMVKSDSVHMPSMVESEIAHELRVRMVA
jgi:hypothetical protein